MLEIFKTLKLDKSDKKPLYMQLYETIKSLIINGTLLPHSKLPSVREFAKILEVNSVTVVSCYKLLETDKYVYSKTGSGTYVDMIVPKAKAESSVENIISDEIYGGEGDIITTGQIKIGESTIDFASATPTPDLFPVEDFKQVLNHVLDRDKGNAFGYQDSQGYLPLRSSICKLLSTGGISVDEDEIQIISGAQQGIDIIAKALLVQGDYVVTESPTYTGAIAVFNSRGANIRDIQLDLDGMNLEILEYTLKKYKPKLIYTIPSFQNPTGITYSVEKRKALLLLAQKYNTYVIEDDYVSELDFEDKNIPSLKSLDKNNRVIFIKSFSKIFMPGLRFGFMIVPSNLREYVIKAKHTTDISTSGLIQRAFDLYIREGMWDKHFSLMYGIYKTRYSKTIEALDNNLPSFIKYHKPDGGLNIWLQFPYGYMINTLLNLCSSKDIVFAPGRIFYSSTSKLNNIRLSFAAVHSEQIGLSIEKLCDLISTFRSEESTNNIPIL